MNSDPEDWMDIDLKNDKIEELFDEPVVSRPYNSRFGFIGPGTLYARPEEYNSFSVNTPTASADMSPNLPNQDLDDRDIATEIVVNEDILEEDPEDKLTTQCLRTEDGYPVTIHDHQSRSYRGFLRFDDSYDGTVMLEGSTDASLLVEETLNIYPHPNNPGNNISQHTT